MLPALVKRLLTIPNRAETFNQGISKAFQAGQFEYTFFDEDGLPNGGVFLAHKTHTFSCFSLTTFGAVSAIISDGVFWQQSFGEVLIDFVVNFSEGGEVDSLTGTLTLLDWLSKKDTGRWIACLHSGGQEVAEFRGIWSRDKL